MRLHWFASRQPTGAPRDVFGATVVASLAVDHEVVLWRRRPEEGPRDLGLEDATFVPANETFFRLNDGVVVFDVAGSAAHRAWIVSVAMTCPGIVLLRDPGCHDLARHLPGGEAHHLRVMHDEHGPEGLDAAIAFWRGDLDLGVLERRFPLLRWLARPSLAVLAHRDVVRDVSSGSVRVWVDELSSTAPDAAGQVRALARMAPELRRAAAANALADSAGRAGRRWVPSRPVADVAFVRAGRAIEALLGGDRR
jgi:hypothetical protein